jgi:hypothetical protein
MTADPPAVPPADSVLEIVEAAAAVEPGRLSLRAVELVYLHDGHPDALAAALIADEV